MAKSYIPGVKSSKPVHAEVTADECNGDLEKMIKRFSKKVKKEGIIAECLERKQYTKPSVLRRRKALRRKSVLNKLKNQKKLEQNDKVQ